MRAMMYPLTLLGVLSPDPHYMYDFPSTLQVQVGKVYFHIYIHDLIYNIIINLESLR